MNPACDIDGIRELVGSTISTTTSPQICCSDVRRHVIATYWPELPPPALWDPILAAADDPIGVVVPEDFNPFAWPVSGPSRLPVHLPPVTGARLLNGGTTVRYGTRMRVGDRIRAVDRVVRAFSKAGRSSPLLFVVTESVWHNDDGDWVKSAELTSVNVLDDVGDGS